MRATLADHDPNYSIESNIAVLATPNPTAPANLPQPQGADDRKTIAAEGSKTLPFPPCQAGSAREFRYRAATFILIGDLLASSFAIFLGLWFREWQLVDTDIDARSVAYSQLLLWSGGAGVLYVWILAILRTYESSNLYRPSRVLKNIGRSIVLWSTIIWASYGLFRAAGFTPRIGAIYCMGTLALVMTGWRVAVFSYLMRPEMRRRASTRVLLVGWNSRVEQLCREFPSKIGQLREIVGCIPGPRGTFSSRPPKEYSIPATGENLTETIHQYAIESVILSDSGCTGAEIQEIAALCQKEMISFQVILDYFPALASALQVQSVNGVPLLGISELPLDQTANRVTKRAVDIIGSLCGLAICALIVPWFCAMVYFESPGPVLFRQRRTSRNGRNFIIYKIRSMHLDAEAETGAVWCKREDQRRLRIGAFMRRWNIDELPQFWNVLKGNMSLVGPRPERPELIERFKHEIPNYNVRHEIRAGLTGWAQVNGLRGDTDLAKRVQADLYYLENWTLSLDLYCIVATLFKCKNAH